mmetsp:Transcript_25552/g.51316  ORF Transcript_25552/g.51316 Transcript_25552/m.51316 type:complete len:262 (+) Transcript_25552:2054-2839(+)
MIIIGNTPRNRQRANGRSARHPDFVSMTLHIEIAPRPLSHAINILIHGGDGTNQFRTWSTSVSHVDILIIFLERTGHRHGRGELAIESHAIGEFVDAVYVPFGWFGEHLKEFRVAFILKTNQQRLRIGDGGFDHHSVQTLRTHGVGTRIRKNRYRISRLHPSILQGVRDEDPQLMTGDHDQIARLLPPLQLGIDHALRRPDQPLAGSRANPIPRRGGLLEKFEGDSPHDPNEVGPRRGLIELRRDAQGVDEIGRRVHVGIP